VYVRGSVSYGSLPHLRRVRQKCVVKESGEPKETPTGKDASVKAVSAKDSVLRGGGRKGGQNGLDGKRSACSTAAAYTEALVGQRKWRRKYLCSKETEEKNVQRKEKGRPCLLRVGNSPAAVHGVAGLNIGTDSKS